MNTVQVLPFVQTSVYGFPTERNHSGTVSNDCSLRTARRKRMAKARARKLRILKVAALGIIVAVILNLIGLISNASETEAPLEYKYYDAITVAYQQDVNDIVDEYCDLRYYQSRDDYVRELYRINNLGYDSSYEQAITPGMHIVVPYYSAEIK